MADEPSNLPPAKSTLPTGKKANLNSTLAGVQSKESLKRGKQVLADHRSVTSSATSDSSMRAPTEEEIEAFKREGEAKAAKVVKADSDPPLPPPPKAVSEPPPSDSNPPRTETTEAMETFVANVDVITDVLLLLLGKFDNALKRINFVVVVAALVGVLVVILLVRIESLISLQQKTQQDSAGNTKTLAKAIQSIEDKSTAVSNKLDTAKEEADKKADIEVKVDETTGAPKLVIRQKLATADAADAPQSVAPKSTAHSASKKRKKKRKKASVGRVVEFDLGKSTVREVPQKALPEQKAASGITPEMMSTPAN